MLLLEPTPQKPPSTFKYPNVSEDIIRPDLSICHPNLNDKDDSRRKRCIKINKKHRNVIWRLKTFHWWEISSPNFTALLLPLSFACSSTNRPETTQRDPTDWLPPHLPKAVMLPPSVYFSVAPSSNFTILSQEYWQWYTFASDTPFHWDDRGH